MEGTVSKCSEDGYGSKLWIKGTDCPLIGVCTHENPAIWLSFSAQVRRQFQVRDVPSDIFQRKVRLRSHCWICMASSFSHRVGGRLVRDGEASFTWCWIHHPKDPNFGDPTNLLGSMTQNDSNRNPTKEVAAIAIDCLWLITMNILLNPINIYQTIHYQYHPLSSITWHLFQLISINDHVFLQCCHPSAESWPGEGNLNTCIMLPALDGVDRCGIHGTLFGCWWEWILSLKIPLQCQKMPMLQSLTVHIYFDRGITGICLLAKFQ